MKRKVIIELEIDPLEYGEPDSPHSTVNLTREILRGDVDLVSQIIITCEDVHHKESITLFARAH